MAISKVLLAIPITFIFLCVCLYGYCELKKAYWDREVRMLCEKDGGVKIYEKVELSPGEYPELITDRGVLMIPLKSHAKKTDPFYLGGNIETLRSGSPTIFRLEQSIVRRKDNKKLSVQVLYSRRGSDFPVGFGPESSFQCGNDIDNIVLSQTVITRKGD